jgi:hypothetical protein
MERCIQPAIYECTCDKCGKLLRRSDSRSDDAPRLSVRFARDHEGRTYDLCVDCFGTIARMLGASDLLAKKIGEFNCY